MAKKPKKKWGTYVVPPNDEQLFYRKVVAVTSNHLISNSKFVSIAKDNNIELKFYRQDQNTPTYVQKGVIALTSDCNGNPDIYALNRHIRNAFCHLNIEVTNQECHLRDCHSEIDSTGKKTTQTTMTGHIDYDDLKNFIHQLIKVK